MSYYPPVSPITAGLACKCPRCGQGQLYDGYLTLRSSCRNCALDYSKADSGDGPAVFVIFIAGFFGVAMTFVARFVWDAPIWVAFLVSVSLVIVLIFLSLRPLKAVMIALQFVNKAEEGKQTGQFTDDQVNMRQQNSDTDVKL